MRNFKFFLLFLTFLCYSKGIAIAQNCNLPAPTGLIWTYPSQNTVKFKWNSVPGAWGYRITMNAQNTQGHGQTIQAPTTEATFTYIPNTTYDVELYCGCSATNFSAQKTILRFTPLGLIIVVDINPGLYMNCPGAQLIWSYLGYLSNNNQVLSSPIESDKPYQIEIKYGSILPVKLALQHKYVLLPDTCKTKINLYPNPNWHLTSYASPLNNHIDRALVVNSAIPKDMHINVDDHSRIVFESKFGEQLLTSIKVFKCESGDLPPGDRSPNSSPTNAASPNPFLNQISVFLKGQTQGTVTAKMLDAAGQLKWIQQYDSASLQDQAFVIQTQDMPAGMYFLQISDARGLLQTQRLIKQ